MSNIAIYKPAPMSPEDVDLLRDTVFKDLDDREMNFAINIVNRTQLDPFLRQIYFVKRRDYKTGKDIIAIQVGIDGLRLIAQRTSSYAGSDDPVFDSEEKPTRATATIYRIVQGIRVPFTATARWKEYCPNPPNDFMWRAKPCVMLAKCAEALALRKGFPAELSGMYAEEEMHSADIVDALAIEAQKQVANQLPRIAPEQPGEIDGVEHDLGYRIPFGKYQKRALEEISIDDLKKYIVYLESTAKKQNKPIVGVVAEFIDRASSHIAAIENQPIEENE